MVRIQYRKARKAYTTEGISPGDMYYFAQIKTGPRSGRTIRSLTKPRPSQLTASEFRIRWLTVAESLDLDYNCTEDLTAETLREKAEELGTLGEETTEHKENMPENLQESPTGELLTERADACNSAQNALEDIADSLDNLEEPNPDDYPTEDKEVDYEDALEEHATALEDLREEARSALPNNEPG